MVNHDSETSRVASSAIHLENPTKIIVIS